ncbi:hypothetical protein [Paenibacillus ihumii]|uniref:hypothetical protein n=1 Tax=Paenibacillus ihumii TaxID=687436 RepID=UPI001CA3295A|nr:hypothetical protein [Paenibacillus ihumii]
MFIVPFFRSYFTESVFYFNEHKYKKVNEQADFAEYRSQTEPLIKVQRIGHDRQVTIQSEEYAIHRLGDPFNIKYEVIYPGGKRFEVNDHNGLLVSYDENGDWFVQMTVFDSSGQRILQEGEEQLERYHPSDLVAAAYPEYHTKQGEPVFFIFSIFMFIYGWCGFRYEGFQNFLFKISLNWLWVREAEPSDFYYFMCKIGGIVAMILSVVMFFKSL